MYRCIYCTHMYVSVTYSLYQSQDAVVWLLCEFNWFAHNVFLVWYRRLLFTIRFYQTANGISCHSNLLFLLAALDRPYFCHRRQLKNGKNIIFLLPSSHSLWFCIVCNRKIYFLIVWDAVCHSRKCQYYAIRRLRTFLK